METAVATATEVPQGHEFDAPEFVISINVRKPNDPKRESDPVYVTHVLKRPTPAQLEAREKQSSAETTSLGANEEEIASNGVGPDLALWSQTIKQIKGYRGLGNNPAELTDWLPEWADKVPIEHKLAVIRALTVRDCEVVTEDFADGFFDVTADSVIVRQKIGGVEVKHTLRRPTEKEYANFKPYSLSLIRKDKQTTTKMRGNLTAHTELYDKLVQNVEGALLDGQPVTVSPFTLKRIDALTKRAVIQALMAANTVAVED